MKICIICKKEFNQNSNVQKFCGNECRKEHNKKYRIEYTLRNREELKLKKRLYDKKYRIENKKKLNQKSREYYSKNKETIFRKYRLKNNKKISLYGKEYYKRNKNKFRGYFLKDIGKYRIRVRNYKKIFKTKTNARNFAKKNNQKDDKCKRCESKENLEFHHTNYEKNEGITLCRKCHREEHRKFKYNQKEVELKSY